MKTITTEEHFNKYFKIRKGIKKEICLNLVEDLYRDINELKEKFLEDKHLNNIRMNLIDFKFHRTRQIFIKNKTSWSLADNCCLIKHILIYDVLKVKPIFQKDILDYDKKRKEWLKISFIKGNLKRYENEDNYFIDKNYI